MEEWITIDDAKYSIDLIRRICSEVGPGMPGTLQERQRALIIKDELKSYLGPQNVAEEEFDVAPWAWLSSYPISAIFMILAVLSNISVEYFAWLPPLLTSLVSLAFSILAFLAIIFIFYLNYEWIDRFFKKKTSINVIGTLRKPGTVKVKRLLILSGHHDSAPENTWLRFLGYGFLAATAIWISGYIAVLAAGVIQLAGLIIENAVVVRFGTISWIMLVFLIAPAIIFALFFNRGRENGGNVPGAVDNLSASAVTVALCRFLVNHPSSIPDGTEIRFISFGSEEAGLRGSRRYVARHLGELTQMDTHIVNFEMISHPEIVILPSEGVVKNSPEVVESLTAAAERAGVPYRIQSLDFGGAGTDGASFSAVHIKAATIIPFKMPQQMIAFYHTKRDGPEVLTIEPILNVLKLTLEWVRNNGD